MLCRALGGKVAKSYSGWDLGVRKVSLTQDFYSLMSHHHDDHDRDRDHDHDHDDDLIPPNLSIIECHQDEVYICIYTFLFFHSYIIIKISV